MASSYFLSERCSKPYTCQPGRAFSSGRLGQVFDVQLDGLSIFSLDQLELNCFRVQIQSDCVGRISAARIQTWLLRSLRRPRLTRSYASSFLPRQLRVKPFMASVSGEQGGGSGEQADIIKSVNYRHPQAGSSPRFTHCFAKYDSGAQTGNQWW